MEKYKQAGTADKREISLPRGPTKRTQKANKLIGLIGHEVAEETENNNQVHDIECDGLMAEGDKITREVPGKNCKCDQGIGDSPRRVFDDLIVRDCVAAIYDGNVYVGQVVDIDRQDGDAKISFIRKTKGLYKWPNTPDILWVRRAIY